MSEENKAIVRRWVEAFNEGNVDAVDELVTDSYVRHDPNSPEVRGPRKPQHLIKMQKSLDRPCTGGCMRVCTSVY